MYSNTSSQYQQPVSAASYGGHQPYGAPQGYPPGQASYAAATISPHLNQASQWATPPPSSTAPQSWHRPAPPPPPQQQQYSRTAPGYKPDVYGTMPGSPAQVPPPPPPKPYQTISSAPPAPQANQRMSLSFNQPPLPSLPQGYQAEVQQNQQGWPQHPPYSSQPPSHRYEPQEQHFAYNQNSQQDNYGGQSSQQYAYDSNAPPPPSQTPGGSYFPPPQPYVAHTGGAAPPAPMSAVAQNTPAYTLSPNQQQPAHVPPSLSGQGVAAYMPSNNNPLPSVYIPPPPESVPAWTQQQHASLAPQTKKFRYTKPVVQTYHQSPGYSYDADPSSSAPVYQNASRLQQQTPQYVYPAQSDYMQSPAQHNQQSQTIPPDTQVQPLQQPSQQYGSPSYQSPAQPAAQSYQQAPVYHQQSQQPQQTYAAQSASPEPWHAQPHQAPGPHHTPSQTHQVQAPLPVHGQLQGRQPNIGDQSQVYDRSASNPQATPVSPVQHRQSISFSQAVADRQRQYGAQRTDSVPAVPKPDISRTASLSTSISEIPEARPAEATTSATSAFALGEGGPSDWEHFGPPGDDEIDDTETLSRKVEPRPVSPQQLDSVELPTQATPPRSIRHESESSAVSLPSESWPTPPAPAPLNIRRPESGFQHAASHRDLYTPTPPPKADGIQYSEPDRPIGDTLPRETVRQPSLQHYEIDRADEQHTNQGHVEPIVPDSSPTNFAINGEAGVPPIDFSSAQSASAANSNKPAQPQPTPVMEYSHLDGASAKHADITPSHHDDANDHTVAASGRPAQYLIDASDLDPWYQASLERYVSMLHHEDSATTVEEKTKVFTSFFAAELAARGIDYPRNAAAVDDHKSTAGVTAKETSEDAAAEKIQSGPSSLPTRPKASSPIPLDTYVMVDDDSEEYSPGGRPIMPRRLTTDQNIQTMKTTSPEDSKTPHLDKPPPREALQQDLIVQTPDQVEQSTSNASPPTPAYRPYRYSIPASGSERSTHSAILTPSSVTDDDMKPFPTQEPVPEPFMYKPYSPNQHREPMANAPRPSLRGSVSSPVGLGLTAGKREHNEIFLDGPERVQVEDQSSTPKQSDTSPPSTAPPTSQPVATPLQSLISLLPSSSSSTASQHPRLDHLRSASTKFTSDYSYIATQTRQFDAAAATTRARLENERHDRQTAAEERHNQLFDEHEINYADIGALEDAFKAQELEKKAQEGRDERQRYIADVFEKVYARLQGEIKALMDLVVETERLVASGVAGRDAFGTPHRSDSDDDTAAPPDLPSAVQLLLDLHAKVEERHEKVAHAIAERDRRFKKTEIQPLYAAGNIGKMKAAERHFEHAEKGAALRAAQEAAGRARRVRERVDEAVGRGVGMNQEYVEEIGAAAARVAEAEDVAAETHHRHRDDEQGQLRDVLERTKAVLSALAQDSQALLHQAHAAELGALNAEFDVSVAQARLDGAEEAVFRKLAEEKAAEERRLQEELEERVRGVEDKVTEVRGLIDGMLEGGGAGRDGDVERERRMSMALEEARRRNGEGR